MQIIKFSSALILAATLTLAAGCSKTPEQLTKEATEYLKKGDRRSAMIQLKEALRLNPADGEVRAMLGNVYAELGDGASAEKELRKAMELGVVAGGRTRVGLARALLVQDKFEELLKDVAPSDSFEVEPQAMVYALRGRAQLGLGNVKDARTTLMHAQSIKADSPDVLILKALVDGVGGNFEASITQLGAIIANTPGHLDALLLRADLLRSQKRLDESLLALDKALEVEPNLIKARIAKATMLVNLARTADAQKEVDQLKKITQQNPLVAHVQAMIYFRDGKYREAESANQDTLKIIPGFPPGQLLSAAISYSTGSFGQAERVLSGFIKQYPGHLYARKLLAATLVAANDGRRAYEVLEPALGAEVRDATVLALAGDAMIRSGRFDQAAGLMSKAVEIDPKNPRFRTRLAESRLGAGESEKAIADLDAARSLGDGDARADSLLVLTLLRKGDLDAAMTAATDFEKRRPKNPLAPTLLGSVEVARKNLDGAIKHFERALALDPAYFSAVWNIAQIEISRKQLDAAADRVEKFLTKNETHLDALMSRAEIAQAQGKTDKYVEWLERARKAHPTAVAPRARLVVHYSKLGDRQKALEIAQEAVSANPAHPGALQLAGMVQATSGDPNSAVASYTRMATASPKSPHAQFNLGSALMSAGNLKDAEAAYRKALALDPGFKEAQGALAATLIRLNRTPEASKIIAKLQAENPKAPVGYLLESDALASQRDYAGALRAAEKAHAVSPGTLTAIKMYMNQAMAGDSAGAIKRLAGWVSERPDDVEARAMLADGYLSKAEYAPAIQHYDEVLKRRPADAQVMNNLANALHRNGDARAQEIAERANKILPNNPLIADTYGWILVGKGAADRGLPLLRAAAEKLGDVPEVRYHLAVALMKTGDRASAKKEVELALKSKRPFAEAEEARALLKQL